MSVNVWFHLAFYVFLLRCIVTSIRRSLASAREALWGFFMPSLRRLHSQAAGSSPWRQLPLPREHLSDIVDGWCVVTCGRVGISSCHSNLRKVSSGICFVVCFDPFFCAALLDIIEPWVLPLPASEEKTARWVSLRMQKVGLDFPSVAWVTLMILHLLCHRSAWDGLENGEEEARFLLITVVSLANQMKKWDCDYCSRRLWHMLHSRVYPYTVRLPQVATLFSESFMNFDWRGWIPHASHLDEMRQCLQRDCMAPLQQVLHMFRLIIPTLQAQFFKGGLESSSLPMWEINACLPSAHIFGLSEK